MDDSEAENITRYFSSKLKQSAQSYDENELQYTKKHIQTAIVRYHSALARDGHLSTSTADSLFGLLATTRLIVDTETHERILRISTTPKATRTYDDKIWYAEKLSSLLNEDIRHYFNPDIANQYNASINADKGDLVELVSDERNVTSPPDPTRKSEVWLVPVVVFVLVSLAVFVWAFRTSNYHILVGWGIGAFTYPIISFLVRRILEMTQR